MSDLTIDLPDGRTIGAADYGSPEHTAVLWCHGGPGSRLEPSSMAAAATEAGFRLIGVDRPGYGLSTMQPGRSIADWVPDAVAVLDHLGIDRCIAVGVSTGGAYSLALAANAPERVSAVVPCCALTDMSWPEGKAIMSINGMDDIWGAPDRESAMAVARELFGDDGSKMVSLAGAGDGPGLPEADMALFTDPEWLGGLMTSMGAMFAQGIGGYADDRIADGVGWRSFDVGAITCPVLVIHGTADTICPVGNAHHTAEIVPGATLRLYDDLGHFSIMTKIVEALAAVR